MKLSVITSTIFSLLLLSACSSENSVTQEFKLYLSSLGTEPVNGNVYLLVTNNECKACVHLNGKNLSPRLNSDLYIISPLPKNHFRNFEHYLNDRSDEMDGLKLLDYETKLLIYDNGQVLFIRPVNVNRLAGEMPAFCKKE